MSAHIKTWVERLHDGVKFCPSTTEMVPAMRAEIAELRATITRYEAQMLRMAQCAGEFAKDAAPLPQQAAGDERGDSWITAKVARHLDLAFRNGVSAGWNAGVDGDDEALQRLKNRVGTRAEYAALFPEPAQQAIKVGKHEQ